MTAQKSFSAGDSVYYHSPEGDTVPAKVLKAGPKKVLISGNFPTGERNTWVTPAKLELQPANAPALEATPAGNELSSEEKQVLRETPVDGLDYMYCAESKWRLRIAKALVKKGLLRSGTRGSHAAFFLTDKGLENQPR